MAQLTNNMTYEFPDELWGVIKDFAGVYHIGIKWDKLEKIGVETIHNHYKDEYRYRIKNYKTDALGTKRIIFKDIFQKYKTKENMIKLYKLITDKYPNKNDKVSNFDCKVGDQICYVSSGWGYGYNDLVGVVTKINKTTVSFKPYKIDRKVSENPNARREQTFETIRYYFDKKNFEKVKTIKNFNLDDSDYVERRIDWGY